MSLIDTLLSASEDQLSLRKGIVLEIPRLTAELGEEFNIEVLPLSDSQVEYLVEICKNQNEFRTNALVESVRIDGEKLSRKDIMDKFGVYSAKEVVPKLFDAGEIRGIYDYINKISGFSIEAVKEVKKN